MIAAAHEPGEHERLANAIAGAGDIESLTAWRRVGEGWNCDTYLVNDAWIVQFPIGEGVRDKLRREVGFLARSRSFLSTPTPVVRLLSEDPFCVAYPVLPGEQALFDVEVSPTGAWPEQLGVTLAELHGIPAADVGWNQEGPEVWQATCQRWFERLLERVLPLLLEEESDTFSMQVQEFLATLGEAFRPSVNPPRCRPRTPLDLQQRRPRRHHRLGRSHGGRSGDRLLVADRSLAR